MSLTQRLWDTALVPALYSVSENLRGTLVRVLAYMGALALFAIVAASFFRTTAFVATVDAPPRPQWIKVARPYAAFELLAPELAAVPFDYSILRRPADGARKDVLTWGSAASDGPSMMVEIYRAGIDTEPFIDAEGEIAARIAGFTVRDGFKAAGLIESKFGPVPLVDFTISSQGKTRRCVGFARRFDRPVMQIAGWYCSPDEEVVARPMLSCTIDRLTINSAGGNSALDELFARAEINRTFCGQRSPILAATPERETAAPAPREEKHSARLRGRTRQR
jgi:hypothetical protein